MLGGSTAQMLRREGRVPGVIYGHGEPSIPFHVKELALRPLIFTHETHTINLNLDGKSTKCILKEIQFHPTTDRVRHIDLVALHAGEKIKVDIPIALEGTSIGVKDGGVLDVILHRITIEVLPDAIPEHISVDISNLAINHSIHVSDLPAHPSFTVLGDEGAVIVTCIPPKTGDAAVSDTPAEVAAEPEQIRAKGKKEDEA